MAQDQAVIAPQKLHLAQAAPFAAKRLTVPGGPGLFVVAGRNNAGKTTFLRALVRAESSAQLPLKTETCGEEYMQSAHPILAERLPKAQLVVRWRRASTASPSDVSVRVETIDPLDPSTAARVAKLQSAAKAKLEHHVTACLLREAATLVSTNRYFASTGHLTESLKEEDIDNFAAFVDVARGQLASETAVRQAIEDFREITDGLEVSLRVDAQDPLRRWLTVREPGQDARLMNECGDGLRDLFLLVVKARLHPRAELLVDEPGLRLHPHAQRKVLRYLSEQSKERGVWIATHDGVFICSELVTGRYGILRSGASSIVEELSSPDDVRRQIDELGWTPRDAYLADRVLYCEGPSDKTIFTHVLRTLATKNPLLEGVNLEELGGDGAAKGGGLGRVVGALQRVAPFAAHVVVLDTGIGAEGEQRAMRGQLEKLGARVHFLKEGELENYFLDAHLIVAVAAITNPGALLNTADVQAILDARKEADKGSTVLQRVWENLLGGTFHKVKAAHAVVQLAQKEAAASLSRLAAEFESYLAD